MKENIKRPSEIKILAKNTVILATPTVLSFFVGVLKSKFLAIFLGTTGVGLVSQLQITIDLIRQSTLSFLPDGMVKLIAQENADKIDLKNIADIIKTYFFMVFPIAIISTTLGYIFSDEMTIYIFGDIKYKIFFLIGFTAIPVSILAASFRAFLKAFKEIKSFAIAEFFVIIINLIIFLPLIYYYKIIGGIIYTTLSFFISFAVILYLVNKNVFKKYNITLSLIRTAIFSQKYFRELMAFISVGIIAGTARVFENITTRSFVVTELGIDKLGVYSPITKWESLFLGFILPAVYTYLYPRLSEAKDNQDLINVINDVIRLITFVTLPFVILAISTRQWIIPLFYSFEFMEATMYLPFHFSALLIAVWGTIFEQLFAPTGRLRVFLFFIIIFEVLSLSLVYYFIPIIGLYGYLLRYTIKPLFILLVFYFFWRRTIKFKIFTENIKIVLYSFFCSLVLLLFKDFNIYLQLLIASILISALLLFMKKEEKIFLIERVNKIIGKFK